MTRNWHPQGCPIAHDQAFGYKHWHTADCGASDFQIAADQHRWEDERGCRFWRPATPYGRRRISIKVRRGTDPLWSRGVTLAEILGAGLLIAAPFAGWQFAVFGVAFILISIGHRLAVANLTRRKDNHDG